MLKLILGDEKGKVQNANVPIRWCINKETLAILEQEKAVNPHILIVTATQNRYYGFKETSRHLAPLDQVIEFIQFQKPEKNFLFATIVWAKNGTYSELWEKFLQKEYRNYNTDVISETGFSPPKKNCIELAEVEVYMPREIFAKEYPAWLKKWVNLWFKSEARDQCHFRKRMIFAFTIKPPIISAFLLVKLVAGIFTSFLFLLLFACKGIDFGPIVHPLRDELNELSSGARYVLYKKWTDKQGDKHVKWHLLPLIPIVPMALFLFHFIENTALNEIYYYVGISWYDFGNAWMSLFATFIGICILVILFSIVDIMNLLMSNQTTKARDFDRVKDKYKNEYFELLCSSDLSTNINSLSYKPRRRMVHLLFQNLKAKVCRPIPQK